MFKKSKCLPKILILCDTRYLEGGFRSDIWNFSFNYFRRDGQSKKRERGTSYSDVPNLIFRHALSALRIASAVRRGDMARIAGFVSELIGHTPLLRLNRV